MGGKATGVLVAKEVVGGGTRGRGEEAGGARGQDALRHNTPLVPQEQIHFPTIRGSSQMLPLSSN